MHIYIYIAYFYGCQHYTSKMAFTLVSGDFVSLGRGHGYLQKSRTSTNMATCHPLIWALDRLMYSKACFGIGLSGFTEGIIHFVLRIQVKNETSQFQNNLSDKFRQHEIKPIVKAIEHSTCSVDLDRPHSKRGVIRESSQPNPFFQWVAWWNRTPCHQNRVSARWSESSNPSGLDGDTPHIIFGCTVHYCIIEILDCMCLQILDEVPWLPHCCLQTCSWCIGNQSPSLNLFTVAT